MIELCTAELVRVEAGHPRLLCVVPPLAGAIAHGLLKAELGPKGTATLQYTSPYRMLASNLAEVGELERPPLWFDESTASPPRLPTEAELRKVLLWWHQNKTVNRGDAATAAMGAGSRAVLPRGSRRKPARPRRLVEEEEED